jgi:hypothetical protein
VTVEPQPLIIVSDVEASSRWYQRLLGCRSAPCAASRRSVLRLGAYPGSVSARRMREDFWEFTPTEEGVYTFFCRIHKSMRGAFKVVDE